MSPLVALATDGQVGDDDMIVGTYFILHLPVLFVSVILILPSKPGVERELLDLQAVVGIERPSGGHLVDMVVSRESALKEIIGTIDI